MIQNIRRSLTDSNLLQKFLWVESVVCKPVVPFGTFEKAKYIMYRYGNDLPLYFFTTTVHNTEECIEIMKNKFNEIRSSEVFCKVFRIQNGVKELVYTDKPFDKP